MVVVVDTCSLSRLVQYYLPFDKGNQLIPLISTLIKNREMIVTEAVFDECRAVAKGTILNHLPFLKEKEFKSLQVKYSDLIPDNKFTNIVNNNFINRIRTKKLSDAELQAQKYNYSKGGDYSLLLCAYYSVKKLEHNLFNEKAYILTEESAVDNDNKCFYKLSKCAEFIGAEHIDLAHYLEIVTNDKLELVLRQ